MWPFGNKKTIAGSEILNGSTDWHCHLLPGVDDGVKKLEDTLALLDLYAQHGVAEVWLTPHIMEDVPNSPEVLQSRFEELQSAYRGPISLHLAAEHMIDNLLEERIDQNRLMPIGSGQDHILVETSYAVAPYDLYGTLQRIQSKGYHPLLAHPERYRYMDNKDYKRLQKMGVKMQLNLFSLIGAYGTDARKRAQYLLQHGYYDVFGTDTHRLRQFQFAIEQAALSTKELNLLPTQKL